MDSSIEKDLPYVQSVYWRIKRQFPQARLKIFWQPIIDSFWITTDDSDLYESKEYLALIRNLYGETLNKTYYEIMFNCLSFGHSLEELDCGTAEDSAEAQARPESEAQVPAKSEAQAHAKTLVRS